MQLVYDGLFPSAPEAPRYAFGMDFLDFYFHLFEHSADSAEAAAAALAGFHRQFGFSLQRADVSNSPGKFNQPCF